MLKHNLSSQKIKALVDKYKVPVTKLISENQEILPVYIEGLTSDGKANSDTINQFNDIAVLFDLTANKILGVWQCTTEAGKDYRIKQLNSAGFALIAWGYQESWQIGRHQTSSSNQYPALVQIGGEVKVIRNRDSNGNRLTGTQHSGYYGINVHTVADNDSDRILEPNELRTVVGKWSAGCTVFPNAEEFYNEFMPVVMNNKRKVIGQLYVPSDDYVAA